MEVAPEAPPEAAEEPVASSCVMAGKKRKHDDSARDEEDKGEEEDDDNVPLSEWALVSKEPSASLPQPGRDEQDAATMGAGVELPGAQSASEGGQEEPPAPSYSAEAAVGAAASPAAWGSAPTDGRTANNLAQLPDADSRMQGPASRLGIKGATASWRKGKRPVGGGHVPSSSKGVDGSTTVAVASAPDDVKQRSAGDEALPHDAVIADDYKFIRVLRDLRDALRHEGKAVRSALVGEAARRLAEHTLMSNGV